MHPGETLIFSVDQVNRVKKSSTLTQKHSERFPGHHPQNILKIGPGKKNRKKFNLRNGGANQTCYKNPLQLATINLSLTTPRCKAFSYGCCISSFSGSPWRIFFQYLQPDSWFQPHIEAKTFPGASYF